MQPTEFTAIVPPPDHGVPDGFMGPPGAIKEVDVAHIGGSTEGPVVPLVVTVAGTGAVGRLSSWTLSSQLAPRYGFIAGVSKTF